MLCYQIGKKPYCFHWLQSTSTDRSILPPTLSCKPSVKCWSTHFTHICHCLTYSTTFCNVLQPEVSCAPNTQIHQCILHSSKLSSSQTTYKLLWISDKSHSHFIKSQRHYLASAKKPLFALHELRKSSENSYVAIENDLRYQYERAIWMTCVSY